MILLFWNQNEKFPILNWFLFIFYIQTPWNQLTAKMFCLGRLRPTGGPEPQFENPCIRERYNCFSQIKLLKDNAHWHITKHIVPPYQFFYFLIFYPYMSRQICWICSSMCVTVQQARTGSLMATNNTASIAQARKQVEQLKMEANIDRIKVRRISTHHFIQLKHINLVRSENEWALLGDS